MSDPWLKFYPTDWRSDPRLRMCSMAARGLWIEMIALMHEAVPYGHLLVSGLSPTNAQLAVLAGAPSDQIPDLLGELESAGVFSRTSAGVVYSRKMTRMAKKAALARKNGKNGGNPSLRKETENPPSDNHEDKGGLKTQKLEARSQSKKEGETYVSLAQPSASRGLRFDEFWTVYPHRNGAKKGKQMALERYRRAVKAGTPEEAILEGARAAHKHPDVVRGFARDPATWLNQSGWQDEVGGGNGVGRFSTIQGKYA
jgi:hypothetical protein